MMSSLRKYLAIIMMINSLNSNAIEHYSGIDNLPIYIFIFSLFLIIVFSFINGIILDLNNKLNIYIFIIILLSFLFLPFWTSYKNIIICIGPLAAFFVLFSLNLDEIKQITWLFLLINLPLALYEYFTTSYLYDIVGTTYGEEVSIVAHADLMRSKGLFASCLGLGYFAMFASYIFNKDLKIMTIALILCLLGGSRQPLALVIIVFFMYFISNLSLKNIFFMVAAGTFVLLFAIYFLQQQAIERILSTADFKNDSSNSLRIFFWLLGITTYFTEYNFLHQVFGDMGYFQEKVGYNAESAWLTLLLDTGFIITSMYLIVFIYLLNSLWKVRDIRRFILVFLILISMWTVPLIHNFNQNMYFWLFIFTVLREVPEKGKKINKIILRLFPSSHFRMGVS